MPAGSGTRQRVGQAMVSVRPPSWLEWPAKRWRAHRLGLPFQAELAFLARDTRIHGHHLAVRRHPGELMAQYQRAIQPVGADAGLGIPVQVGAAQAHGHDAHQGFIGARCGPWLGVDAHIARGVDAGDLHPASSNGLSTATPYGSSVSSPPAM